MATTARFVSASLETALEQTAPTRTQCHAWTRRELSLAGLTYQDLRRELRTGGQDRKHELLGALVQATHTDPDAFSVVAACLLPGLRHRIGRYAPTLDRQEAFAVMVEALDEAVGDYDTGPASPVRRRRATRPAHPPTPPRRPADLEPPRPPRHRRGFACGRPGPVGRRHVGVGRRRRCVHHPGRAQLTLDTRIAGRSLREADRRLDLSYETAKKRPQRAQTRWATWWTNGATSMSQRRNAGRPRGEETP
ncbi:MAG: hypothetical protein ACRD0W_08725 [Acidimicrobiales bacterium]